MNYFSIPNIISHILISILFCSKVFRIEECPYDAAAYVAAIKLPIISLGGLTDLFGDESVMFYTYVNDFLYILYIDIQFIYS